ncbi:MAG TPA: pyridoxal phosphate-dependent aminotransferase [Candidatus Koribacter sp.]|jgi:histidinol-phosphate aminotransferase
MTFDRRSFLRTAGFASVAAAVANFTESQFALAQRPDMPRFSRDAVFINANENPLGPCDAALAAMASAVVDCGRYRDDLTVDLIHLFAEQFGLRPEYVSPYPGSSQPLTYSVWAFADKERPVVVGDPGYEAAGHTAAFAGIPSIKVPLTSTYAHDVKGMVAASPNAGLYYIASPNNPTGTVTPRADVEWLLANKPKGSIVLLDEAYIHFSDATPCLDLVAQDKDIVVLRTFSKLYGMAGARLGLVVARPDLMKKIEAIGGWTFCPVTAVQGGIAALKDTTVVAKRKQLNAAARQETFEWLTSKSFSFVPSEANHFMLDTKRPTKQVIDSMAAKKIYIGRAWPAWPTHVRITVGTRDEMARFRAAFEEVMAQPLNANIPSHTHTRTELFS